MPLATAAYPDPGRGRRRRRRGRLPARPWRRRRAGRAAVQLPRRGRADRAPPGRSAPSSARGRRRRDRSPPAIVGFAPGLLGYGLFALLTRALYARGDDRRGDGRDAPAGWSSPAAVAAAGVLLPAADRVLAVTAGQLGRHAGARRAAARGGARGAGAPRSPGRPGPGVPVASAACSPGSPGWAVAGWLDGSDGGTPDVGGGARSGHAVRGRGRGGVPRRGLVVDRRDVRPMLAAVRAGLPAGASGGRRPGSGRGDGRRRRRVTSSRQPAQARGAGARAPAPAASASTCRRWPVAWSPRGAAVLVCGPAATEEQFGFTARRRAVRAGGDPGQPAPGRRRRGPARCAGRSPAAHVDVVHAHGLRAGLVAALARPAGRRWWSPGTTRCSPAGCGAAVRAGRADGGPGRRGHPRRLRRTWSSGPPRSAPATPGSAPVAAPALPAPRRRRGRGTRRVRRRAGPAADPLGRPAAPAEALRRADRRRRPLAYAYPAAGRGDRRQRAGVSAAGRADLRSRAPR